MHLLSEVTETPAWTVADASHAVEIDDEVYNHSLLFPDVLAYLRIMVTRITNRLPTRVVSAASVFNPASPTARWIFAYVCVTLCHFPFLFHLANCLTRRHQRTKPYSASNPMYADTPVLTSNPIISWRSAPQNSSPLPPRVGAPYSEWIILGGRRF